MKRILRLAGCAVLVAALLQTAAMAVSPAWGSVQDTSAILYLLGVEDGDELSCLVGNVRAEIGTQSPMKDEEVSVETVIILDNSISILESERPAITALLQNLVTNRLNGEQYTIATISQEVTYICKSETDSDVLNTAIQNLTYHNQDTKLVEGMLQVLEELSSRNAGILRRIVLIADGVNNTTTSDHTWTELNDLIKSECYPVYTVACTNAYGGTVEEVQNLASLSRLKYGASFTLSEVEDVTTIAESVREWNSALRVVIPLPEEVCDGSGKAVQVSTASGQTYTVQLTMPTVEKVTPEPSASSSHEEEPPAAPPPAASSEEEEEEPESESVLSMPMIILIAVAAVLVIVLIVVIIVMVRRKIQEKNQITTLPPEDSPIYEGVTEAVAPQDVDPDYQPTEAMWDEPQTRVLVLRDIQNPSLCFEKTLREQVRITVGRGGKGGSVDVPLKHPTVSHHQCDIYERADGQVIVKHDMKAKNSTYINDEEVDGEGELRTGDILTMGSISLEVEIR